MLMFVYIVAWICLHGHCFENHVRAYPDFVLVYPDIVGVYSDLVGPHPMTDLVGDYPDLVEGISRCNAWVKMYLFTDPKVMPIVWCQAEHTGGSQYNFYSDGRVEVVPP
jgi:hypothetical protein